GGIVRTRDEPFLLETIHEMGDGGQRHGECLAHVAHAATGIRRDVEEHLPLRVGEIELGRALPEKLPEDGASERVQEIEEALGLRGPFSAARATAFGRHPHNPASTKQLSQLSILARRQRRPTTTAAATICSSVSS